MARAPRDVGQPNLPAQNCGLLLVGRRLHPRLDAVQRMDDRETIEARLFDSIVSGPSRRLEADRPRRFPLFADIEEMAARLQRIERAADEIDRAASALLPQHGRSAAAITHDFEADSAVVEDVAFGFAAEFARCAIKPWGRRPDPPA